MQVNFFIIVVIVFGLILFVAEHFTRKKHEKNLAYAQSRGWRYHKQHPTLARVAVQMVGGGRRSNSFRMVFEGQSAGRPFLAGTARWTESSGSGKNRSSETHYRRVVLRPIELNVRDVRLVKEGFFNNLFNRDIKTEWEVFNEQWKVTAPDERFVHALLSPTMQEWLMRHSDLNLCLDSGWLAFYTNGQLAAEEVDSIVARSDGFLAQIPRFLWQDYGYPGGRR